MREYQKEVRRMAIRRSSRDNQREKQSAMMALHQSHAKGNSTASALQPNLSAERALYRSGGDRSAIQATLSHSALLQLQRIHGNRYISRMLQAAEDSESNVTQDVEHTIERSRGGGQALDDGVRHSMGKAMNADFSRVRVHTDSQADGLNRSLQARAFTTGRDVFFRQGEYNPGSSSGRELLAHELTHVVQQGGSAVQSKNEEENAESACSGCAANSPVGALQTKLTLGAPNDIYEQEADAVASAYINWEHQTVAKDSTGLQVRRQEGEEVEEKNDSLVMAKLLDGYVLRQAENETEKEEEMVQTKSDASRLLRQPEEEKEEEPLRAKLDHNSLQRQPEEMEEELLQGKYESVQCQSPEEEEAVALRGKSTASVMPIQLQSKLGDTANLTGMSGRLKAGMEAFSGINFLGIPDHTNSSKPAQLNALTHTQRQGLYLDPGQEKHLPHEGWHAVQQKKGQVKPTMHAKGGSISEAAGRSSEGLLRVYAGTASHRLYPSPSIQLLGQTLPYLGPLASYLNPGNQLRRIMLPGLSPRQKTLLDGIFGNSLATSIIRLNPNSILAAGNCYRTTGSQINMPGTTITDSHLIHEAAHVWQSQNTIFGVGYAVSALKAQALAQILGGDWQRAYDYRNVERHRIPWRFWNAEQQASWIQHNRRLPSGWMLQGLLPIPQVGTDVVESTGLE